MKPIAFVIPWYGEDTKGGAETACNYLARNLTNAGQNIEVLTSCVKKPADDRGKNTIEPGVYNDNGVTVRRFLVREDRAIEAYNYSNLRIYSNDFDDRDEEVYFKEDINSPEMYAYIRNNYDNYRYFVFMPYMYGIVYNGSFDCAEKSILIPCLHDESYAYMNLMKSKMKSFKGMIFLSQPEYELAMSLYDLRAVKCAVLGTGIDTKWRNSINPERFRKKYNIKDDFILYMGKKDEGKKADELAMFFIRYKDENPERKLKLLYLGGGELPVNIPTKHQHDILSLGFVSNEDKYDALGAATLLCNPSYVESFSIVIMESWLAKRPVLVSGHCKVTKHFCVESNGGLYYDSYYDFFYCLDYIIKNKSIANQMGNNGYNYVMGKFTHEIIADSYIRFFNSLVY